MDFARSREQQQLADTVSSLLAKRSDTAAVRAAIEAPQGFDEDLWRILCEQVGAAALSIPEPYGGAGFSLVETFIVLEQLGAALTPSPMLGSGVLATAALLLAADEGACADVLPGLADGSSIASLAWDRTTNPPSVKADGTSLSGTVSRVLDGDIADVLLVLADTGPGTGLFLVDPDQSAIRRTRTETMDQTLRLATIDLHAAKARRVGGEVDWLPTLRDIGCAAVSSLQVGAMQRCLDLTVEYTRQRRQFGRPIGSFQALKHRMADLYVALETSRSASWAASWSAAHRDLELPERAGVAAAWCSASAELVATETVQLHGGVAITWEHDAQLLFKRLHALGQLFGPAHTHRRRLASPVPSR